MPTPTKPSRISKAVIRLQGDFTLSLAEAEYDCDNMANCCQQTSQQFCNLVIRICHEVGENQMYIWVSLLLRSSYLQWKPEPQSWSVLQLKLPCKFQSWQDVSSSGSSLIYCRLFCFKSSLRTVILTVRDALWVEMYLGWCFASMWVCAWICWDCFNMWGLDVQVLLALATSFVSPACKQGGLLTYARRCVQYMRKRPKCLTSLI